MIDLMRVGAIGQRSADALWDRFYSQVSVLEEHECWEWFGKKRRDGYGVVSVGSGWRLGAHRVSFLLDQGWLPTVDDSGEPLVVRHTCDNPPCVNPTHLVYGTHADNYRDAVARGRHRGFAVLSSEDRSRSGREAGLLRREYTLDDLKRCEGLSIRKSAELLGCGTATVSRLRRLSMAQ